MSLDSKSVHQQLQTAAQKMRWSQGARPLILGLAIGFFFLTLFLIGDTQFHFGRMGRWLGLLFTILPAIIGCGLAIPSFSKKISPESMARRIEQASSGSRNVLINAVQFDQTLTHDSPLRSALFEEMHDPFPKVRWSIVFDLLLLKRLGLILAAIMLILALWGIIQPEHFGNSAARIFMPSRNIAPLTSTQILKLTPGDGLIAHGGDMKLVLKLGGTIPNLVWVHFREAGSSWQKSLMDRDIGQPEFNFAWQQIKQPIEYYVEAGDIRSVTYEIKVRPKIAIKQRVAEITPPAYTRLTSYKLKDFTHLQNILPGSRVIISLEFNGTLTDIEASSENSETIKISKRDETHWNLDSTILKSQTIKFNYHDSSGMADSDSLQITVKPDEPPKINISVPVEGQEILTTADASLLIQFTVTDLFGLGQVAIYKSAQDKPDSELIHPWPEAKGQKTFTGSFKLPLRSYVGKNENQVTFSVIASNQNNVTGPGITISRPIIITIRNSDQLKEKTKEAQTQLHHHLDELIQLQQTNLNDTREARKQANAPLDPLVVNQVKIAEINQQIIEAAESITPEIRSNLQTLGDVEMKDAVLNLRNASNTTEEARSKSLENATALESAILARLKGAPIAMDDATSKGQVQDLIAGVEELFQKQRELLHQTEKANDQTAQSLSDQQDALSERAIQIRKEIDKSAQNPSIGDADFRSRLTKVSAMFGEFKIYEEMLTAADQLQNKKLIEACSIEKREVVNLAKIIEFLNQWELKQAGEKAEALKKEAAELKTKLDQLAATQHEIIEKSKELAHKDEFRPEDQATAKQIQLSKDQMAKAVEQMLTDAHIFPDMKPSNELRSELTQIYEDVMQTDKQDAAEGKLTPKDIAVQKEDEILQAIEKATKIAEDMEMWLPNKNDTTKWQLENFDKTEMPDIPNLPLPDAFEDIVGKLLDEQEGLAEQVQDAASNQAFAQNEANGWEIADGAMPGFGAQGKSGNQRPKKNEQTGRSSGGREGESSGEMVGDRASNLEGTKPDARRTNDPMQQGHVKDEGGIGQTRATGGGKAGGFSDRNGMDGNAPLRSTNAPAMAATDALAVKAALLAEKTSRKCAEASLLYLHTGSLPDVARLMSESQIALKEGRIKDFQSIHKKIVTRLNEVRGEIQSNETLSMPGKSGIRSTDKSLLGGDEGQAPDSYKKQVGDYYRSLNEEPK